MLVPNPISVFFRHAKPHSTAELVAAKIQMLIARLLETCLLVFDTIVLPPRANVPLKTLPFVPPLTVSGEIGVLGRLALSLAVLVNLLKPEQSMLPLNMVVPSATVIQPIPLLVILNAVSRTVPSILGANGPPPVTIVQTQLSMKLEPEPRIPRAVEDIVVPSLDIIFPKPSLALLVLLEIVLVSTHPDLVIAQQMDNLATIPLPTVSLCHRLELELLALS
jgi:hypothetical protein